jgi:hypothetical protein
MRASRSVGLPGKLLSIAALLVLPAVLIHVYADDEPAQFNFFDIGSIAERIAALFFHASTSDIFPTTPITVSPTNQRFRLDVCSRQDVGKCMYYGEARLGKIKLASSLRR